MDSREQLGFSINPDTRSDTIEVLSRLPYADVHFLIKELMGATPSDYRFLTASPQSIFLHLMARLTEHDNVHKATINWDGVIIHIDDASLSVGDLTLDFKEDEYPGVIAEHIISLKDSLDEQGLEGDENEQPPA